MAVPLTILMPVFNERATVEAAIADALDTELPVASRQLVVVDDGSTDGTRELLASREWGEDVEIVAHPRNLGKGAAVRTALQHAKGTFSAILDADLEYAAADLGSLLEPLLSGEANVVFGSRAFTSQSSFSFWYVMGNKSVTLATNVIYNCWISDVMTCHKAMRTDLFRSLRLRERGFAIEPEIAARVLRSGERIYEVPVSYQARTRAEGKKLTAADGLRVLRTLVRCRIDGAQHASERRSAERLRDVTGVLLLGLALVTCTACVLTAVGRPKLCGVVRAGRVPRRVGRTSRRRLRPFAVWRNRHGRTFRRVHWCTRACARPVARPWNSEAAAVSARGCVRRRQHCAIRRSRSSACWRPWSFSMRR